MCTGKEILNVISLVYYLCIISNNILVYFGTLNIFFFSYSALKAALTSFIDCIRDQNRHRSTKIIEIYPPVVQCKPF